MKALIFIYEIFGKFPALLITNIILVVSMSLLSAFSLLMMGPLLDFLIKPDLHDISPLTRKVVDLMGLFGMPATFWIWLIIFMILIFSSSIFEIFARQSILKTKYAVMRDMILGTFDDFFKAGWLFFSSGKQGTLLNAFTRELNIVGDAFGAMALFFAGALQTLFYLAVPLYISWRVTAVSLGAAVLFMTPFLFLGKLGYRLGAMNIATGKNMMSIIHENLTLAKIVLGFSNQRKAVAGLALAFDAHSKVTLKSQLIGLASCSLHYPFGVLVAVTAFFTARKFGIALSETLVLIIALRQISISLGALTAQKNSLETFFPSYEEIENLRKRAVRLRQRSGIRKFDGSFNELRIEKLSFAYPGHKPVLVDIDARIPKGTMAAFVGESGVGKSTLVDVLMGFHEPASGRIMFDDIPLEDFDIASYRREVGYVPQDSVLFNMTVRDNLLWACEGATDEDIERSCSQANADEFIRKLPEGYDTLVGDRGIRLSGGQIQRIALARAVLRRPSLLILDEATSSLDTHSERLIQTAIEEIAKDTTVIVIAHRLSTIVRAGRIYVLREGRVVEKGAYQDLVQMDGHFNRMTKLQALETK